jgi:serine/threonine-protein kinase
MGEVYEAEHTVKQWTVARRAETPDDRAGLIACGTSNDHANVIWSNDARLMLSDATGDPATVEDLHTWWDAYG